MSNLKKGAQLILLFTVNFFNVGVFADQFTEDCGRIIDINDYKRCTRKQFTISLYYFFGATEVRSKSAI